MTEMDGFSSREGIIVLAATNQPDVLDKALLRPGRFDRHVVVNLPDKTGREAILKVHVRRVPLASDVSLADLAGVTPGLSGADLKNLVNEAALLAARREENEVHQKDFLDALEKIVLGPARPLLLSHADKERIAYHEGGHTILGLVVPGADPVNRVTIVPRGRALGVTYESVAQKVQADLKKVNIDVQLVPEEFSVMLTKYRAKDRTAVISYNQPDYLGPSDWAGQMILNTWAPRLHYDSKQAVDLTNQAGAEVDPEKRAKLYQQVLALLVDEGPYVMLVQGKAPVVTRANVQNWVYFPIGDARLFGVSKS